MFKGRSGLGQTQGLLCRSPPGWPLWLGYLHARCRRRREEAFWARESTTSPPYVGAYNLARFRAEIESSGLARELHGLRSRRRLSAHARWPQESAPPYVGAYNLARFREEFELSGPARAPKRTPVTERHVPCSRPFQRRAEETARPSRSQVRSGNPYRQCLSHRPAPVTPARSDSHFGRPRCCRCVCSPGFDRPFAHPPAQPTLKQAITRIAHSGLPLAGRIAYGSLRHADDRWPDRAQSACAMTRAVLRARCVVRRGSKGCIPEAGAPDSSRTCPARSGPGKAPASCGPSWPAEDHSIGQPRPWPLKCTRTAMPEPAGRQACVGRPGNGEHGRFWNSNPDCSPPGEWGHAGFGARRPASARTANGNRAEEGLRAPGG
jgi:hypothetical protein